MILEQQEEVLKETFREAAKEQLTKRIFEKIDGNADKAQSAAQPPVQPVTQNKDKWIKDLRNVAVEMIEGSEKPVLSKQQKKQWNDLQEVPQAQGEGEQQVEDD